MSWSRNARLFAFEQNEGACLPIEPIINAVVGNLKFKGYISVEMFSRELLVEDLEIPRMYAARGKISNHGMSAFVLAVPGSSELQ